MAIDRTGINSLNAGAPDLRLEGDIASIQAIPIEIQKMILQYWIQQGSGSPADRIEDVPKEFRDRILQLFKRASAEEAPTGYDEYRLNELKNQRLPEPPEWYNKEIEMAYGGTARPTYTQSRKQRMAYGGIAGLDGRKRYGIGSWFQENIMDPIKSTADKLIPNELKNPVGAALAGTALNYAPVMMGGEDTLIQKGLGALGVPEKYTQTNALDFLRSIGTDPNVVSGISGEINPFDPTDPGKSRPIVGYDDKTGNPIYGPSEAEKADQGIISKGLEALKKFVLPSGSGTGTGYDDQGRPIINWQDPLKYGAMIGALDYALRDKTPFPMDQTGIKFQTAQEAMADPELRFKPQAQYADVAEGGRIRAQEGGLMDLGGLEKDYRQEGGFVPIGGQEKADDVPARLSKNEFVFTADAVRAAGGGDIDKGAEIMENLMDNLEAGGKVSEESQGLEGAQEMFANTQQLEKRII